MFSEVLKRTGQYSDGDIILFEQEVKLRKVPKGELLLRDGEIARSIFFIKKGAIYQCGPKPGAEKNIIDLHTENDWVLNHKSFISQSPSESIIVAFTESDVLEISIESIHDLINRSPAFLQLNRIIEQATSRLYFFDHSLTPLQKYQYLFENKPHLIQTFPLKFIAGFLKITPETLSRVREKFVKSKSSS